MELNFKVGDKVKTTARFSGDPRNVGVEGEVVGRTYGYVIVRMMLPDYPTITEWFLAPSEIVLIKERVSTPTIASDLKLTPQAKTVLRHLQKRQHISPAEALIVYGISRLASCIHEIRKRAGYDVTTEVRRDEQGHKYANYTLVTSSAH